MLNSSTKCSIWKKSLRMSNPQKHTRLMSEKEWVQHQKANRDAVNHDYLWGKVTFRMRLIEQGWKLLQNNNLALQPEQEFQIFALQGSNLWLDEVFSESIPYCILISLFNSISYRIARFSGCHSKSINKHMEMLLMV